MEIGSEFNLDLNSLSIVNDNVFNYIGTDYNIVYTDSGRGAIRLVSNLLSQTDRVLLPEFICDSVTLCFNLESIDFYKINRDFSINIEDLEKKVSKKTRIIFLMHYFGSIQPEGTLERIRTVSAANGCTILEDVTHSLFSQKNTIGDYVVCSLRKWLPISSGAFLMIINNSLSISEIELEKSADNRRSYGMVLKNLFLQGELDCNSIYRKIFKESEETLNSNIEVKEMSDFSRFVCNCISVNKLKTKRINNLHSLSALLERVGMAPAIQFHPDDCPLVLPVRVNKRDELRQFLITNSIYCAVHWPFDGICPSERLMAIDNSKELISLPIDQRYNVEQMEYLATVISEIAGEFECLR